MEFIYVSQIFFFVSLIFLLIQGIINNKFYRFKILERTEYEQFAYEVYSSINKILPININFKEKCSRSEELLQFNLNLNGYYDCRGTFNDLGYCENTIINNYTKCDSGTKENIANYHITTTDERVQCEYFTKFTRTINGLNGKKFCSIKNKLLTYEFLLKNIKDNGCEIFFKKCGILDIFGHPVCIPDEYECPKNEFIIYEDKDKYNYKEDLQINDAEYMHLINDDSKPIINSVIISDSSPLNHEWALMVRETYEKIDDENIQKRRNLTRDFHEKKSDYYRILDNSKKLNLTVNNITDNHYIKGIESNIYNLIQRLDIYARGYIGFQNVKELNKFQKIFNDKNYRDNPLYKISSKGHDPLFTIIISAVFLFAVFVYFILYYIKKFPQYIYQILFYIFFGSLCIFILAELIIISVHFGKYKIIHINMEERMKDILNKYNKRRINCQLYRIISLVMNVFSFIFCILSLKKDNNNFQQLLN